VVQGLKLIAFENMGAKEVAKFANFSLVFYYSKTGQEIKDPTNRLISKKNVLPGWTWWLLISLLQNLCKILYTKDFSSFENIWGPGRHAWPHRHDVTKHDEAVQ